MVVEWPEGFAVGGVERVRQLHFLPAERVGGHALHVYGDLRATEGGEVQRHEVIDALAGQADIERLGSRAVVVADEGDFGLRRVVLNGQEEVMLCVAHGDEVVFARQMADAQLAVRGPGR